MSYPELGHIGFKMLCAFYGFVALHHSSARLDAKAQEIKYLKEIVEALQSKTKRN